MKKTFNFLKAERTCYGKPTTVVTSGDVEVGYPKGNWDDGYALSIYFSIPDDDDLCNYYFNSVRVIFPSSSVIMELDSYDLSSNPPTYTGTTSLSYADINAYYIIGSKYLYYNSESNHNSLYKNGILYQVSSLDYHDENVEAYRNSKSRTIYLYFWMSYELYNRLRATIKNVQNLKLEVTCEPIKFNITPVYPIDVNIKNSSNNNFTWSINKNHSRTSFTASSAVVSITQGETVKNFNAQNAENYATINSGSLDTGDASWVVKITNSYGTVDTSSSSNFIVVGTSSAPTITSVTQDSFPTITWTAEDQQMWQLVVRGENGVVFDSNMRAKKTKSFQLTTMLENGSYYAEVRILNKYGYYSDWGTYGFVLLPTAPSAPANIIVSSRSDFGVAIDCEVPEDAGTLYVVRRQHSTDKPVLIGEYSEGFVDYTIPINTTFEYSVRNYNTGYADGEWLDATVNASGIVLRDGRAIDKFINLWKVEDGEFNLISNDARSVTLVQCIGRTYPVKEISEWITSTRSVEIFVPFDVYGQLLDMATNSNCVYLQNKGEFIPCNIELSDRGEYIGKGRIVEIELTRIDGV